MMAEVKMTVRMLESLRGSLKAEAEALGITLNELAVMKLSQPLPATCQQTIDTRHDVDLLSQLNQQTRQLDQLLTMVASIMPAKSASIQPAPLLPEDASSLPAKGVCESKRLGEEWSLKKFLTQKSAGTSWRVFVEDRVVAIDRKSANGTQHWLEVWKEYPDAVWDACCDRLEYNHEPVTLLETELAKATHPVIQEAKSKGWVCPERKLRYDLDNTIEIAEEYLAELAITTPESESQVPEVLSTEQLAQRCCPGQNAKQLAAKVKTLREVSLDKLQKGWTSRQDPEGLVWIPDETRSNWVCQQTASSIAM